MSVLQRRESEPVLVAWRQLTSSIEIGPDHDLSITGNSDSSLRIEALARLFVIDRTIVRPESLGTLVSETYQSIGDALMLLATEDPDTCCAVLETLETMIQKTSPDAPSKPISLLMAHTHRVILEATDPEVISKAQSVLAEALDDSSARTEFFSLIIDTQLLGTLKKLEDQCLSAPPSNTQTALHLFGFFINHAYHTLTDSRDFILASSTRYIRLLRMTITDTNPFDTRFAAAQSICALHHLWTTTTTTSQPSPLVLGLNLILCDMLQDDDDEIRAAAAMATATSLSTQTNRSVEPTTPLLAQQHLLTHLLLTFPKSQLFATHALRRLLGTPSPSPLFTTPFAVLLEEVTKPQTVLFATEKQNLYLDTVLDAESWSRVLRSSPNLAPSTLESACEWTSTALSVLAERYTNDIDGALGWASKPDVFAWVVRVISLSDVLLQSGADKTGRTGIKLGLARLGEAMRVGEASGVLVDRLEGVLEGDVLRGLGVVRGVAREAPEYAGGWLGV